MVETDWSIRARRSLRAVARGVRLLGIESGSSSSEQVPTVAGFKSPTNEKLSCVSKGGTLISLQENDFEHLDPGIAYYSTDYIGRVRDPAAAVLEQAEHSV